MRQVMLRDGRLAWVNTEGKIVGISDGMGGAEPGFGESSRSQLPPPNVYHPDARTRDIMSRLPSADIVGLQGPGVTPGGEQPAGARHRDIAQSNQPPPALTYRPLAGSQVNNRGNVQVVTLATNLGGPTQKVASIVETPKDCGNDAEVITVQLGIELPSTMTDPTSDWGGVDLDVTALVTWGVGNAFYTAEVDWQQGTVFAVCASFVRVSARVGPIAAIAFPDIQIVLRASLAYGNANSISVSSEARRTVRLEDVAGPFAGGLGPGAASLLFPIPLWALGFTILDAGLLAGGVAIPDYDVILNDGNSRVAVYTVKSRSNIATQVEGQFPIPAKARYIQVVNNLGLAVAKPTALFNLGL